MAEKRDLAPGVILVGQDSGRRIRLVRRETRHDHSGWIIDPIALDGEAATWISEWQLSHFRIVKVKGWRCAVCKRPLMGPAERCSGSFTDDDHPPSAPAEPVEADDG